MQYLPRVFLSKAPIARRVGTDQVPPRAGRQGHPPMLPPNGTSGHYVEIRYETLDQNTPRRRRAYLHQRNRVGEMKTPASACHQIGLAKIIKIFYNHVSLLPAHTQTFQSRSEHMNSYVISNVPATNTKLYQGPTTFQLPCRSLLSVRIGFLSSYLYSVYSRSLRNL